jgi:hypothetical protein
MSHFYTVVLVPKNTDDIEAKIEELLAPYDETIEVEEYDRKCWCINHKAHSAGWAAAESKYGSFSSLRESFWNEIELRMPKDLSPDDDNYYKVRERIGDEVNWKNWTEAFRKFANLIETSHPLYNKPNPKCDRCSGTGYYKSTYNPESKWDWWVIGGRWDGIIQNNYRSDGDGGFNFGKEHHQVKHNTVSCKDFLEMVKQDSDQYPYSLVTPKGEWCEKGKMGWFGTSSDEKEADNWHDIVNKILKKYEDCIAVGCDLHI